MAGKTAGFGTAISFNFSGDEVSAFSDHHGRSSEAIFKVVSALGIVVVVAVVLRTYNLGKESLWLDEAYSVYIYGHGLSQALAAEKTNPPLYYLLLHFWMKLFGSTEAGVRSLSVVGSIAGLLITYLLGKRLYNEKTGLLAACFMSVSPYQILLAQEARSFTLSLTLLTGSAFFMYVASESRRGRSEILPWILYFLTTVGALYTHYYAVFFVAAENIYALVRWRRDGKRIASWGLVQVCILLAFLPWLITMLEAASGGGQHRRYLLLNFPRAIFALFVGESLVPMDERAVLAVWPTLRYNWHLIVITAVGFGWFLWMALLDMRKWGRSTQFVLIMSLGPMLMAWIISFKISLFNHRYLIGVSAPLCLLLARGALRAFEGEGHLKKPLLRATSVVAVFLVALVTAISLYNYNFNPRFGKEQWREVVKDIESKAVKGDLVVFYVGFIETPYDYYAKRTDLAKLRMGWNIDNNEREWARALKEIRRHDRVWLVCSHFPTSHDVDVIREKLRGTVYTKDIFRYERDHGIIVYLLER